MRSRKARGEVPEESSLEITARPRPPSANPRGRSSPTISHCTGKTWPHSTLRVLVLPRASPTLLPERLGEPCFLLFSSKRCGYVLSCAWTHVRAPSRELFAPLRIRSAEFIAAANGKWKCCTGKSRWGVDRRSDERDVRSRRRSTSMPASSPPVIGYGNIVMGMFQLLLVSEFIETRWRVMALH